MKTLNDCKEMIAKQYGKTHSQVRQDFEFGMGISKLMSEEDFMDRAANLYAEESKKPLLKALRKINKLSQYGRNHDNVLYNFQYIRGLTEEILSNKPK